MSFKTFAFLFTLSLSAFGCVDEYPEVVSEGSVVPPETASGHSDGTDPEDPPSEVNFQDLDNLVGDSQGLENPQDVDLTTNIPVRRGRLVEEGRTLDGRFLEVEETPTLGGRFVEEDDGGDEEEVVEEEVVEEGEEEVLCALADGDSGCPSTHECVMNNGEGRCVEKGVSA